METHCLTAFIWLLIRFKGFFFRPLLTMYFFWGQLSFYVFWLWMTHNVLKHEGSKFVRRVSLTFGSFVCVFFFQNKKISLLFSGTIKIIYAHCKEWKKDRRKIREKGRTQTYRKIRGRRPISSKITSLEKTSKSMLADIFLDNFMWIRILYKRIQFSSVTQLSPTIIFYSLKYIW